MDVFEKLKEFHTKFGMSINTTSFETPEAAYLRENLIREEFNEVLEAFVNKDNENLLKELVDLVYVTVGTAVAFGWDFNAAFDRVHQSNLSKLSKDGKPVLRSDGKVLKGPNYIKANLSDLI